MESETYFPEIAVKRGAPPPEQTLPAPASARPHLVIKATSGWKALDILPVWQYRDLLFTLAARDLKLRYKQTALGVVWVILQPLIAAGIFSFVFGKIAKMDSEGSPYIVFSYAGLLAWNAFSGTLAKVSTCLVGNSNLISKVFFPRLVLPLSSVFSVLIDFGVALGMMFVLLVAFHISPGAGILLLPVWLLLVLMLAMGVGLYAAALMVSYRDVQYMLPVATSFLLYGSPIAYAVSKVPEQYRAAYYLNPLAGLLEAFRWSLLGRGELHSGPLLYSVVFTGCVFVTGAFAFKKMERKFADVI